MRSKESSETWAAIAVAAKPIIPTKAERKNEFGANMEGLNKFA
jgi:hypothetical protein